MTKKRRSRVALDQLGKWMNGAPNMHGREAILMHRLCFDLKLAAARRDYYLNTYYDDVDHDGFDLIFDDQDTLLKTQVKTAHSASGAGQWKIHKRIFRPSFENVGKLGFPASHEGEGVEGAFILMRFYTAEPDLRVDYFYTDLFVWLAFACGVIRRKDDVGHVAVEACLNSLATGLGNERVKVPRALMLHAKGPDELLALAGLHSRAPFDWKHWVMVIANHARPYTQPKLPKPRPLGELKRMAASEIQKLVLDEDLHVDC